MKDRLQMVLVQLLEHYLGMTAESSAFQAKLKAQRAREHPGMNTSELGVSAYFVKVSEKCIQEEM